MKKQTRYLVKGYRDNDDTIWSKYAIHCQTAKRARKAIERLRKMGYHDFELTRQTRIRLGTVHGSSRYSYKTLSF